MTTISCTLDQEDHRSRRERWLVLGSRALVMVETTERGLLLVFVDEPEVGEELVELAALERECCAFATWTVSDGEDRVVLDVEGKSEDAVPAVQAMFAPLRDLIATTSG